jgi:hypothetical protein
LAAQKSGKLRSFSGSSGQRGKTATTEQSVQTSEDLPRPTNAVLLGRKQPKVEILNQPKPTPKLIECDHNIIHGI